MSAEFSEMRSTISEAAEHGKHEGLHLMESLKQRGSDVITNQKSKVASQLKSVSRLIRDSAGRLHEEKSHRAADYAEALADKVEQISEDLESYDIGTLADNAVSQARSAMRSRPEVFLGGMFAAGLIAARFMKSSSRGADQLVNPRGAERTYGDVRTDWENLGSEKGSCSPDMSSANI